ncbi:MULTISPECIES: hypothetical protein [unclassified Mesorhizobium]|uniref:hypothetical protein n=1 Tax=unclassified Mesorhizobium TaxID=325217 RepID=UPI001FE19645|nr:MULTISPECIES: hypothetical protein [unclassified Mesorhizobium]
MRSLACDTVIPVSSGEAFRLSLLQLLAVGLAVSHVEFPFTRKYVGSAFINPSRASRERLWKRVQEHAGPPPKGMKRPATQWVKPGLIGRVKHLRGEEDLRHASLQDFREESEW